MGLPKIDIVFKSKAQSLLLRGERGIVALLLKDTNNKVYEIKSIADIPEDLSEDNKKYVLDAYKGNDTVPLKIFAITFDELDKGLKTLETLHFQYGAIPGIEDEDAEMVSLWVKESRDKKDLTFKMVLPNVEADHEGIINFTTKEIILKNNEIRSTSEFTARIAGLLAGTPLTKSATFSILDDIKSVERIGVEEADERINNGEFILINENNKVKVGRAVNSLTTVDENKNKQWKKILIVEKMDMWKDDVKSTISDYYVGNYSNIYDNKVLLITDIRLYNKQLAKEGILDNSMPHYNDVFIDLEEQALYLESIGELKEGMDEEAIKKANTDDKVFIGTNLKFTDAMEDFKITATI